MGCFTAAAVQLPPEVMVDKYLLQVTMLSEEKDYKGALEAMERVVALQKEHNLTLSEEFPFHYAQTALAAGSVQAAIDSANRYLTTVGKKGKHYQEALELLVKAEQRLPEPAVDRAGAKSVETAIEQKHQAVSPSPPEPPKTSRAQPVASCKGWNTEGYFESATIEQVTACLQAGVDLKARHDSGFEPLHRAAARTDHPEVIKALLAAGADLKARSLVEEVGQLEAGDMVRQNGAYQDTYTYSHVYSAVQRIVLELQSQDFDSHLVVESPMGKRFSRNDDQEDKRRSLLPLLLDKTGEYKIMVSSTSSGETGRYSLRIGNEQTPLHVAAWRNANPAVTEALVQAGADLKAQDKFKRTPLQVAAWGNENPAVIEILLQAGADLMARDKYESTPLHSAARYNANPEVTETLLQAGADVTAQADRKYTPLHLAAGGNKNPAVIEALLKAGADVEAQTKKKWTPLRLAAGNNENPAVTEILLKAGADLMAQDKWKYTPLHSAARYNANPEVTETLLQAGADVTAQADRKYTPLHLAAGGNKNPAVIEALLKAGADVEAQTKKKWTPLHLAASSNENVVVIEALLQAGADPMAQDKDKWTPLHSAASSNENPAVIETLLQAGADLTARDKWKYTPLHRAARNNENPAVIEALLQAGADLMARDKDKWTPLYFAASRNKNPAVIEALLQAGADLKARDKWKYTPLHWAAHESENPAVIEVLLKAGADLTARDKWKYTPLHEAAQYNENPAVIETLLKAGADLMAKAKNKWTPLHLAADRNENPAVTETLLKAGADLEARDKWKRTPLHRAAGNNANPAVIGTLLKAGADLEARTKKKRTPLHLAASGNKNPAVIETLLKAGADLEARDKGKANWGKYTPLHWAARSNENPAVIETLLKAGADLEARTNWGKYTPLHWAVLDNKNPAVIEALLQAGANQNARDIGGDTPLHNASREYVPEIMKMLIEHGADMLAFNEKGKTPWGVGGKKSDKILDEAWEKLSEEQRADAVSRQKRVLAARRRAKEASGPSFLDLAIGAAGGAAIAAAGGGTEEAIKMGSIYAGTVIGGQQPVGNTGGGVSSASGNPGGSSGDFDEALHNLEASCGEKYRSAFSEQDHGRFYCLDAFARHCALKKGHDQQQLDALRRDFEILRSQGLESRCPYFGVLGGTYDENQAIPEMPESVSEKKAAGPVIKKRTLPTCADGDTVPIAVAEGEKAGCPPERWCRWNACRDDDCRRRYPECQPGVLQ